MSNYKAGPEYWTYSIFYTKNFIFRNRRISKTISRTYKSNWKVGPGSWEAEDQGYRSSKYVADYGKTEGCGQAATAGN